MIPIVNGNALNATENIICHQINCRGVMNKGLHLDIRVKYPEVYYTCLITASKSKYSKELLGDVLYTSTRHNNTIANIFAQYDYGPNKVHTDYEALRKGLEDICSRNESVAIPYDIGSDEVSGGDIEIIHKIINEVFEGRTDVRIYKSR